MVSAEMGQLRHKRVSVGAEHNDDGKEQIRGPAQIVSPHRQDEQDAPELQGCKAAVNVTQV